MTNQDVEKILADIRAQVTGSLSVETTSQPINGANQPTLTVSNEPLPRNYPSLTVLARAWDRLPPLLSNRSGLSARIELWLKAKLKRALKWITWEQVNFNAATHHTFLELIEALNAHEQRLLALQNQLTVESHAMRDQIAELKGQRAELLTKIDSHIISQREHLEKQQGELAAQRSLVSNNHHDIGTRLEELQRLITAERALAETRLTQFIAESRERDEQLLDEQRVCFKQLSLELTESQVLQDRARRELESRIDSMSE